jgi:hypothetical protein
MLGWPPKKELKVTMIPKIINTKTTCVTKVEEMYMWQ